jgi:hypothetical protein
MPQAFKPHPGQPNGSKLWQLKYQLIDEIQFPTSCYSNPFDLMTDAAAGEDTNPISIFASYCCLLLATIPAANCRKF